MLGFDYKHRNAPPAELCSCPPYESYENDWVLEGEWPPKEVGYCQKLSEHFPTVTRTPWLPGFLRFGGRPIPTAASKEVDDHDICNNFLGLVYEDDEHVAKVVVDLLGSRSRAGVPHLAALLTEDAEC